MNKELEFKEIIQEKSKVKLIHFLEKEENCKNIIDKNLFFDNLDYICNNFNEYIIEYIINKLVNYNEFINNNFLILFDYKFSQFFYTKLFNTLDLKIRDLTYIFNYILTSNNKSEYLYNASINFLINNEKYKDFFFNNIEKFIKYSTNILYLKKRYKDDFVLINKLNEQINKHPEIIIYDILTNSTNKNKQRIDNEDIIDYIKIIINELLNYENKKYSDIEFLDKGSNNLVYVIGDKVLKLGKRDGFNIDNNKRFLKPLLRTKIDSKIDDSTLFYIEITEKVDTNNITLEDAYFIYKELRDEGYVCLDCTLDNIGRLKKKNKVYFKSGINPNYETINYNTVSKEELEKGELVFIDNELIFDENWFLENIGFDNEDFDEYDNIIKFENRYQESKKTFNFSKNSV